MSLKIGDKVKMTKQGFRFYGNVDRCFEAFNCRGFVDQKSYTQSIAEQFSIHGIGTVLRFNSEKDPYVRWEHSLDGIYYFYEFYYDRLDVRKLNKLEQFHLKIKGLYEKCIKICRRFHNRSTNGCCK